MEHLALEVFDLPNPDGSASTGSKYAFLPKDTVINITDTSEIFASGDTWSHSFTLNVRANAHIFGTSGELHGSRLHEQINNRRARLWIEGLPWYIGYLKLDDETDVDVNGDVEVHFESGRKTFDEMIEGAKASQVPTMGNVPIGVALWRKRKVFYDIRLSASAQFTNGRTSNSSDITCTNDGVETNEIHVESDGEVTAVQEYPRMVFPKGDFVDRATSHIEHIDCLNTDSPYTEDENGTPTHPFCNIALCYQKYGYDKKDDKGNVNPDYSTEPEPQRGYEYMPANRVNSAPNFFVIYWLRCLMKHLGIHIEENQMMGVEDLRRLFFVNTKCAYEEPDYLRTNDGDSEIDTYAFNEERLVPEQMKDMEWIQTKECGFEVECEIPDPTVVPAPPSSIAQYIPTIEKILVRLTRGNRPYGDPSYVQNNNYLHAAYASSECFPDVEISEVISALENGFGVRFLFSDDYRRVRVVLLREIFRNTEVQEIQCEISEESKTENGIRGFRLTYGNSEDTHFYYKGFADMLPHKEELWQDNSDKHDYSQWSLDEEYQNLLNKVSAFNKTCYVTPATGNAYGVKIDKSAQRYDALHPSLFEYAGFMDAEDGDCTGEAATIHEINVGFTPAIMNDLNMDEERSSASRRQKFALFVDEQMRPRRPDLEDGTDYNNSDAYYDVDGVLYNKKLFPAGNKMKSGGVIKPGEFAVTSDIEVIKSGLKTTLTYTVRVPWAPQDVRVFTIEWPITDMLIKGHINEGYRLYLQDNYTPTDDGVSPIEAHDWGLTLGIMRGSGSDASVKYEADDDDQEGNDTWDIEPGSSITAHPDTCDSYGNVWDYNGRNIVETPGEAIIWLNRLFPNSNAEFYNSAGFINGPRLMDITDNQGNVHHVLFDKQRCKNGVVTQVITMSQLNSYVSGLSGHPTSEILALDSEAFRLIVEIDSTEERARTLGVLGYIAYAGLTGPYEIDDAGISSRYSRLSLKLRGEKPDPRYDTTLPDIVKTREQAAEAMTKLYKTSDADLLDRPSVSNATLRAAGWDCPGDGYSTIFGVCYAVQCADGGTHNVLWSPIKPDGTVKTKAALEAYVFSFNGVGNIGQISGLDTWQLILDVDTTEKRAEILQELQGVYYAEEGENTAPVDISQLRYLDISNPLLRGRGLADQLYKEYSYWMRNARITNKTIHIGIAQLLGIDKTVRQRIGDTTGFVRKIQLSVSNETGLGPSKVELMYI